MSRSYAAVVGVGLPYYDVLEEGEHWDEHFDHDVVNMIQPYFDASRENSYLAVVAYKVEYGTIETDLMSAQDKINKAFAAFKKETGKDGKLIISTDSW